MVRVSGNRDIKSRVVLLSINVAVMVLSLTLRRIFILSDFFKPSFFMVCASEMVTMLNTDRKMPARITVSFFDHVDICGSSLTYGRSSVLIARRDLHVMRSPQRYHGWQGRHYTVWPPSTTIACPMTKAASSEHSQTTAAAISSGFPIRPIGSCA